MQVAEKKVITMAYIIRQDDANGEILHEIDDDRPFVYLFGEGGLLPAFESKLEGLKRSDTFAFMLNKNEAYGAPSKESIIELDKSIFNENEEVDKSQIQIGSNVHIQDEDGYPFSGVITAVNEDTITVDFNHPLAGMNLHFAGNILDVRNATPEELEHAHAHHADDGHHE